MEKDYDTYVKTFNDADQNDQSKNETMVRAYYDISTIFYEKFWGNSFHFANIFYGDSGNEATIRYEHLIASKLQVKPGENVLDLGCGVGGPLCNVAKFTKCNITGININELQIDHANKNIAKNKLTGCKAIKNNFHSLDFPDQSIDGIYSFEAMIHSFDKVKAFSEAKRVLKPGRYFVFTDWCHTDKFDPNNKEHVELSELIRIGNGLPSITSYRVVLDQIKEAGFELIENCDLAEDSPIPWWTTLQNYNYGFVKSGLEIFASTLEKCKFPQGVINSHRNLMKGSKGLYESGKLGIFSALYLFVVRVPA